MRSNPDGKPNRSDQGKSDDRDTPNGEPEHSKSNGESGRTWPWLAGPSTDDDSDAE